MPTRLPVLLHRRKSAAAALTSAVSTVPAMSACRTTIGGCQPNGACDLAWRISLIVSRPVNEYGTEIIDIRESWPRRHQAPQAGKKSGRIVVGEKRGRIEAESGRPGGVGRFHVGPGGVPRTAAAPVGTVGIGRKRRDAGAVLQREREGERIFLVRTAAPLAADRDGQFPARQDDGAAAGRLHVE